MKVIFLDIDGVLNCRYTKEEIYSFTFVAPKKIELLKQLMEHTGAEVVLSSSWRHGWADLDAGIKDSMDVKLFTALKDELEKYNIHFIDYTPITNGVRGMRGEEVDMWLKSWKGEEIESFVILDDLNGVFLRPYASRLVQTSMSKGLQDYHIEKATVLLNKPCRKEKKMVSKRLDGENFSMYCTKDR